MHSDRNTLAAETLIERLREARIGVVVRGVADIEPLVVAESVAESLGRHLYVAAVGQPAADGPYLTVAGDIETAVSWRHTPTLAGRIVVFVHDDAAKLHSLADLDSLTGRDLARHLVGWAKAKLNDNQPQGAFWDALASELPQFPLAMVEGFVKEVSNGRGVAPDDVQVIPKALWRLGLLRDDNLLRTGRDPKDRLTRNSEVLMEMGQLSDASRKRMSAALAQATGPNRERLTKGFHRLRSFFQHGNVSVLRELDLATVEELIKAGRPLPTAVVCERPVPATAPDDAPPRAERTLSGRELNREVAELAVSNDDESRRGLRELGEELRRRLNDPQAGQEPLTIDSGFKGVGIQPDLPPTGLRHLVGSACGLHQWGGTLDSDRTKLKDAVGAFTPDRFVAYDPEDAAQGALGQSLFSLLRRFDEILEHGDAFGQALEDLKEARKALLPYLNLILALPVVAFGGFDDAWAGLHAYLDAYARLLSLFRQNEAVLHNQNSVGVKFAAAELLRLDVVRIHTPDGWKALLTPLHPFHLWRFREVLRAVREPGKPLNEDEQAQFAAALVELPQLLHFVVFSPDGTSKDEVLPQSGALDGLPTYENHTNRFLGADGIDYLSELMRRWQDYAPYSIPQMRVALVDVPDLQRAVKVATDFLYKEPKSSLVIDAYFTRGQSAETELAALDFNDKDYDVGELLRSGRLEVLVRPIADLKKVAAAFEERPVHIAYLFDQTQYEVGHGPRAQQLFVNPLVVTYQYDYDESFRRGSMTPSSEANEGLFADFHFLVKLTASLPPGQQLRLLYDASIELEPINSLLREGAVRWLALADRTLAPYAPDGAVPLTDRREGQRELAVWADGESRAVTRFVDLLRRYNLRPDPGRVSELLRTFGHNADKGLLSLPGRGVQAAARESAEKGLLGTVLAAAWYTTRYPGALVASLDSALARLWLKARLQGDSRADLVGVRFIKRDDETEEVIVEVIEVKTRADEGELTLRTTANGPRVFMGKAAEQLRTMLEVLAPIFGSTDGQPVLTPARREILKYQLHRECFRDVHNPEWQRDWYYRLQKAFAIPFSTVPVTTRGIIIHVRLDEPKDLETEMEDDPQGIVRFTIGTSGIQRLVGELHFDEPVNLEEAFEPKSDRRVDGSSSMTPSTSLEIDLPATELAEPDANTIAVPVSPPSIKASETPKTSQAAAAPAEAWSPTEPDRLEAKELARLFKSACQAYHVRLDECDPEKAVAGPTVWRFYVRLARGQKLNPLRDNLEDIGREMRRSGLLVANVPNSEYITLDVPRANQESIPFSRARAKLQRSASPEEMPVPIGVTPEGEDIVRDLGKMPHLLVGGTTGAGKTVFLYGLLASLLITHPGPKDIEILLCSSAGEDFAFFEGLPQLISGQVITDAAAAIDLLRTRIESEFEGRSATLAAARCRDIGEYNARRGEKMPPLVVVVDEFADLADQLADDKTAKKAFYDVVRRIAQVGRKRGVHLVLCTQRPSATLVPTDIRSLLNARVALRMNDSGASRMVLEENGAEQLQMRGDLLFKESAALARVRGYYLGSEELESLMYELRDAAQRP